MKSISVLVFINFFICYITSAQDAVKDFKWTPFKYNNSDLPFSFGIGPTSGISNSGPSIGVTLDCDIYHILVGGRVFMHGFPATELISVNEKSILIGYQFRLSKYMFSIGYGIGTLSYLCKSGLNEDCRNVDEEILLSKALKFEFDYVFNPHASVGISFNSTMNERSDVSAILMGMKFGILRRKVKNPEK